MEMPAVETVSTLERAVGGDQAAFAELVREHQGMVYSIAWHCLHDSALAEELAQDVFLQLYRSMGSIESPAHLTHWLRRVASNRAIDQARRRKLIGWTSLEGAPEPAAIRADADPFLSDRLERMVARLPERSRMMVILRYQEDMDPLEIAAALEVPVGTVKSTLHRALESLRGRMERFGVGGSK